MESNKFKLEVQIGKKPAQDKIFNFETDDPIGCLTSIKLPKLFEPCTFMLEVGGQKAKRIVNAPQARHIFNSGLRAHYFIKNLMWMLK